MLSTKMHHLKMGFSKCIYPKHTRT